MGAFSLILKYYYIRYAGIIILIKNLLSLIKTAK